MRFFSPTSFWNTPISAGATTDPTSSAVVAWLAAQSHTINYASYTIPIYRVPATQPRRRVTVGKKPGTSLVTASAITQLQSEWEHVPLPSSAQPSAGFDKAMTVICGNELWDFFGFAWQQDGTAKSGWGGYISDWTTHPGIFTAADFQGAAAPGFPGVGGLVTVADCESGGIDHALGIALPARKGLLAAPALRTDGHNEDPHAALEGSQFQLDPTFDISRLPAFTQKLARAAQLFGIIVNNYSSAAPLIVEDCTHMGAANPFTKPGGYFGGMGAFALAQAFPWSHLRLLKMATRVYP